MAISIVLADDHPVVRTGTRTLLEAEEDFILLGEANDGLETVRLVERLQPDVLVLDLMMPGLNGLDVLRILTRRAPRTRVVVFSVLTAETTVQEAFQQGALGYVLKTSGPAQLVQAIRAAAAGRRFLSPPFSERAIAAKLARTKPRPDPHDLLSPREHEVLQLVAEGGTNVEIARRLSISSRTVEMHRANLMRKLGLHNLTELIRYAVRRGIIPTQD